MKTYELSPKRDNRKSFYGKATVVVEDYVKETLFSYGTPVAIFDQEYGTVKFLPEATASATTLRHVVEFTWQNTGVVVNKKIVLEGQVQNPNANWKVA